MICPYAKCMDAMTDWLRCCGVRVYFADPPSPWGHETVAGVYRSETREIWISPDDRRSMMLTLAHEAGHWLGYMIHERVEASKREQQAYVYGWHVLRQFDAPVTRQEWIAECRVNELCRKTRGLHDSAQ